MESGMQELTLVYWKSERFWLGKLAEHPEIMTQGETTETRARVSGSRYRDILSSTTDW